MTNNPEKRIILIVDDEQLIHDNLEINLRDIEHENRPIEFLHALSASEAQIVLKNNPEISVIILDVMMERDDAGLDFVKVVRDDLKNNDVRILLHTGQPGIAPKREVSECYTIDGYLDKNISDNDDCYVAVKLALKSYEERLKLKAQSSKDDVSLLSEIAENYIYFLEHPEVYENYESTFSRINSMVHLSQEILASYALEDLKNGLDAGTTKLNRLSKRDYLALIQIHNIKMILIHTPIENYKQEQIILLDTINQAARNFITIKILNQEFKDKINNLL